MPFDVDQCLTQVVHEEGSDLHLKVNAPPMARVHGKLRPLAADGEPLRAEDTESALRKLIDSDRAREEFVADGEADFSYELKGVSRFRVNAFRQRGAVSIVCRAIPFQVRTIADLGLPPVIEQLADEQRGIILLTGTTGSGKSTTLAAMIDHINNSYPHHIITLEDPIEYLHRDKRSIINQREVGSDTKGFAAAMKRVLRQDPDVILVGEMRDEETVRTALSAAETGHLVLSTLHTLDATETVNRIIDFFPPHLQQQARVMLASTLKGAVSQRLVPTTDGNGRVAASEILVVTGRVQDLILNPNETGKISQVIAEGEYYGMQTFDQSLLSHVAEGRVAEVTAMGYASNPHDFKLMLASSGRRASDISQLLDDESAAGAEEPAPQTSREPAPPVQSPPTPESAPAATAEPAVPSQLQPAAQPQPAPPVQRPPAVVQPEYGAEAVVDAGPDAEPGPTPVEAAAGPGPDGLGSAHFAELWEQTAPEAAPAAPVPPPEDERPAPERDRLAEFRPRP